MVAVNAAKSITWWVKREQSGSRNNAYRQDKKISRAKALLNFLISSHFTRYSFLTSRRLRVNAPSGSLPPKTWTARQTHGSMPVCPIALRERTQSNSFRLSILNLTQFYF